MQELRFCQKWFSGVLEVSLYVNIQKVDIICNPTFSTGEWLNLLLIFQKEGAWQISILREGCAEKVGVNFFKEELQFLHKNKYKSEIFNGTKSLYTKMFFSVINKNLKKVKKENLTKNLVVFKQWDGVKDGKS